MKIIGTGLSGLVGSRVVELLGDKYSFEDISRKTGTDIVDRQAVFDRLKNSSADIVLHFAAKTDVDGCEKDKALGENGEAWKINVTGTKNIIDACREFHKKLIFMSTDFVFSGNDTPVGGYKEEDTTNPINWYGQTKLEAEKVIQKSGLSWCIVRIGTPYRAHFEKKDFVRLLLHLLQEGKEIKVVNDQKFNPTFIDDIATALHVLIEKDHTGIFHLLGSETIIPYEGVLQMAEMFGLDTNLIMPVSFQAFFKDRAKRPIDLTMNNDKITRLGINMKGFKEGLEALKEQKVL